MAAKASDTRTRSTDFTVEVCEECGGTGDLFRQRLEAYYKRLSEVHQKLAAVTQGDSPFDNAVGQVGAPPKKSGNHLCEKCEGTGFNPGVDVLRVIQCLRRYIDRAIQEALHNGGNTDGEEETDANG